MFGLRLSHEALPFLISDSYQTPMQGAGTERLVLPAGFTARTAIGPSVLPALGGQFASHPLGSQRKQTELALSRELNEAWQLRGSVGHELKWGSKATGASAGTAGGSAMILPEKIHATTDQFNLALEYAAERRHLQLSYYGSLYRNQVDSLRYQNPFSAGQLENRLGVAPDNQFHQWKLDGGLNLGSTTRMCWTVPVLANGKIYCRNAAGDVVCLDVSGK